MDLDDELWQMVYHTVRLSADHLPSDSQVIDLIVDKYGKYLKDLINLPGLFKTEVLRLLLVERPNADTYFHL